MQAFPYARFPVNKKHSALFVTVCAKKEYTGKKKKATEIIKEWKN